MHKPTYVLVTAAYNEERFVAKTIESVLSQTVLPAQWVIVSDASTDRTDEVIRRYANEHSFIRLLRITEDHPRNFAAQVNAIKKGWTSLQGSQFEFFGNMDADLSFDPTYFELLLARFQMNPRLGLAGGIIQERDGTTSVAPHGERLQAVPHAIQLFRRQCYVEIGGYPLLRYGGPDTYAEVMARMKDWEVEGYADLVVQHHRYTASAGGVLRGRFRQGLMDHSLGYDPMFQLVKCTRRIVQRPAGIGALVRMAGFLWACATRSERQVSDEFIQFLRGEQRSRLLAFLPRSLPLFSKVVSR
jgi:poly-beta-1,6-N-acetyl-D-glucosamine synthase